MLLCIFLPWLGLMIAGYCLGKLYLKQTHPAYRKKFLLISGCVMILLFIAIRLINIYGDMHHWQQQATTFFTVLDFINTTKYPPSLLYMLMTIGPALIFLAYAENISNWLSVITILYFPCKWYSRYKANHPQNKWLSYL